VFEKKTDDLNRRLNDLLFVRALDIRQQKNKTAQKSLSAPVKNSSTELILPLNYFKKSDFCSIMGIHSDLRRLIKHVSMNLKRLNLTRYFLLTCFSLALPALFTSAAIKNKGKINLSKNQYARIPVALDLYRVLSLDSLGLSRQAFEDAVTGYLNLLKTGTIQNRSILSIVDFSIPSFRKRLFVLDMEKGKLLFNTLVAHGRNSGQILATRFSNQFRSLKSSLGFYLTGDTYEGKKGLALRLMGVERGINDNAFSRGIVVHAAPYVNDEISKMWGRLGRSEGCPAIPVDMNGPVIDAIKNGSCFFIYGNDKRYASRSKLLKEAGLS
jgi:hypothetical protein